MNMTFQQLRDITQKVEIFVSCRDLMDKDVLSKSDPFVTLQVKNFATHKFEKMGRTEQIKNNLNPNFTKSFLLDYVFEFRQECIFEVFDGDGDSSEFLGRCNTSIGEIVGAKDNVLVVPLKDAKKGKIILRCENVQENEDSFAFNMQGDNIKDTSGCCGSSQVKLRFLKIKENGMNILVHETREQPVRGPVWQNIQGEMRKFCNGDPNSAVSIELVQGPTLVGKTNFTVQQLIEQKGTPSLIVRDKSNKEVGKLFITNFRYIKQPTFLQYIRGGVQLNLQIAIDFTASNGTFTNPNSLHHLSNNLNQYEQALQAVSEILIDYDYDKYVPVQGFGARIQGVSQQVEHCFPLNGNPQNPTVYGVQGIMQSYRQILPRLAFNGPTFFNHILRQSLQQIQQQNCPNVYTILLILTDGEIHDMDQTMGLLSQGSDEPFSVIIVGIGNANFSKMEILDGDSGEFKNYGLNPKRDITQFVEYNKFKQNQIELAKNVLKEVPGQLQKYYKLKNIEPNSVNTVNVDQIGFTINDNINNQPPPQQYQQQQPPLNNMNQDPNQQYPPFNNGNQGPNQSIPYQPQPGFNGNMNQAPNQSMPYQQQPGFNNQIPNQSIPYQQQPPPNQKQIY